MKIKKIRRNCLKRHELKYIKLIIRNVHDRYLTVKINYIYIIRNKSYKVFQDNFLFYILFINYTHTILKVLYE